MLDDVRPMQENLHARYASAAEQLEALLTLKEEVVLEQEKLKKSVQQEHIEAEKAKRDREEALRALEEAGPAQLSKSDVLISVSFEGVKEPLELQPWDTNFEAVVKRWLEAVQRSSKLQPSLVRYLTHLED